MKPDCLAPEALIKDFPYEVHQIRGPDGELVWVERGVNPDNVFNDKRRSDWPYSAVLADLICQQIVEGASLTQACKLKGFPPYGVVCRWRRANPDFAEALRQAYEDRAEFYLESALNIVNELSSKHEVRTARLRLDITKWLVACSSQGSVAENKTPINISVSA